MIMLRKLLHLVLLTIVLYLSVSFLDSVVLETERYGFYVSFTLLLLAVFLVELVLHPTLRLLLPPIRLLPFGSISFFLSTGLIYILTLFHPLFQVTNIFSYLFLGVIFAVLQKIGT